MIAEYELSRESDERLCFRSGNDEVCPPHFHRKIELLYILDGEKIIKSDNNEYLLKKDNLFIADSYVMHSYIKSENGKQIVLIIPNHMLTDYYLLYSNMKLNNLVIDDLSITKEIKSIIEKIQENKNNPLILRGLINVLLGIIVNKVGLTQRVKQFDLRSFEEVLAYINENYMDEITLDQLAEQFGYSKFHFSRMFNRFLNTNLATYLSMIRLQAAIEKLKKEKCSVSEAALTSGFSSMQTFYRVLKKNYDYKSIKDIVNDNKLL